MSIRSRNYHFSFVHSSLESASPGRFFGIIAYTALFAFNKVAMQRNGARPTTKWLSIPLLIVSSFAIVNQINVSHRSTPFFINKSLLPVNHQLIIKLTTREPPLIHSPSTKPRRPARSGEFTHGGAGDHRSKAKSGAARGRHSGSLPVTVRR